MSQYLRVAVLTVVRKRGFPQKISVTAQRDINHTATGISSSRNSDIIRSRKLPLNATSTTLSICLSVLSVAGNATFYLEIRVHRVIWHSIRKKGPELDNRATKKAETPPHTTQRSGGRSSQGNNAIFLRSWDTLLTVAQNATAAHGLKLLHYSQRYKAQGQNSQAQTSICIKSS